MNPFVSKSVGSLEKQTTLTMYCAACTAVINDWEKVKCESCNATVLYDKPTGERRKYADILYVLSMENIYSRPNYQKRKILLSENVDLDLIDTKLLINTDCMVYHFRDRCQLYQLKRRVHNMISHDNTNVWFY